MYKVSPKLYWRFEKNCVHFVCCVNYCRFLLEPGHLELKTHVSHKNGPKSPKLAEYL